MKTKETPKQTLRTTLKRNEFKYSAIYLKKQLSVGEKKEK